MDRRLKKTLVASLIALGGIVLPLLALAQPGSYEYSNYGNNDLPPSQQNPELPKGLTLVPWKIERRTSLSEIRSGEAPRPGVPRQARPSQANPGQSR